MRHNELRDLEAEMLAGVCKNVSTEPILQPCNGHSFKNVSTNMAKDARLDVAATGFWTPMQKVFLDVRVFHPNAASYINSKPASVYKTHECAKRNEYSERVINVEHGSFTPLIFSTTGGMGRENATYHNRLAMLTAKKTNVDYPLVVSYMRRRIRFTLLRTTLLAIRGTRNAKPKDFIRKKFNDIDINLVEAISSF